MKIILGCAQNRKEEEVLLKAPEIVTLIVERLGIRKPYPRENLHPYFVRKDFNGLLAAVAHALRLDLPMTIAFVRSGGPEKAPAWIRMPYDMPPYGTPAFERTRVVVYVRRHFLEHAPFESIVLAYAHECAHIIMSSTGHPLREHEPAIDIAAMVLGFCEYFESGWIVSRDCMPDKDGKPLKLSWFERLLDMKPPSHRKPCYLGYLTARELHEAAETIRYLRAIHL